MHLSKMCHIEHIVPRAHSPLFSALDSLELKTSFLSSKFPGEFHAIKRGKIRYPSSCSNNNDIFEAEPGSRQSEGVFSSRLSGSLWMEEILNFPASL